jgi:hypothetical protein
LGCAHPQTSARTWTAACETWLTHGCVSDRLGQTAQNAPKSRASLLGRRGKFHGCRPVASARPGLEPRTRDSSWMITCSDMLSRTGRTVCRRSSSTWQGTCSNISATTVSSRADNIVIGPCQRYGDYSLDGRIANKSKDNTSDEVHPSPNTLVRTRIRTNSQSG